MNEIRKKRMEELIVRELADLIHKRKSKDERIGFVSLTGADISPDLSALRVSVSLFASDEENRATFKALTVHAGFFQSTLARNLRLRQTPHLTFEIDTSIREGDRIIDIMES